MPDYCIATADTHGPWAPCDQPFSHGLGHEPSSGLDPSNHRHGSTAAVGRRVRRTSPVATTETINLLARWSAFWVRLMLSRKRKTAAADLQPTFDGADRLAYRELFAMDLLPACAKV